MEVTVRSKVTEFLKRIIRYVLIILFVANLAVHLGTQKCTWICPMMELEKKIGWQSKFSQYSTKREVFSYWSCSCYVYYHK